MIAQTLQKLERSRGIRGSLRVRMSRMIEATWAMSAPRPVLTPDDTQPSLPVLEERTSNTLIDTMAAIKQISGEETMAKMLEELLTDRKAICDLLDALPSCVSCGKAVATSVVVIPGHSLTDLDFEPELPLVRMVCDTCELPDQVTHVQMMPTAQAVRELTRRRKAWEGD